VLTSGRAVRFLPQSEVPSGTISGVVRNDSYGGVPIPNAEVAIEELDRSFVTGENGTYGGTAPVGVYTVTASHPGFDPETVENVEILQGQPTVVDFDLVDNAGPILTTTTHPSTADSAGPYPIPVTIVEHSGLPQKSLFYKTYGQTFTEIPLESLGGEEYLAEIPGQPYISQVQYYVRAEDGLGQTTLDPPGAPEELYTFFVAPMTDLFADDMESDTGWIVGAGDDDADTGVWERVDPTGTDYEGEYVQPEDDHTPAGTDCFVTDGRGGSQGDYDVDGGKTTLFSPILDLSSYGTITLRYYRWYTNDTGNAPGEDVFEVSISDDAGQTWSGVESTNESDRSWRMMEFSLEDLIDDYSQVQLRFVASDFGAGSIVEAAIDDVALILTGVVDAPDGPAEPLVFSLMPSRPNPSQGGATISFSLERAGKVRLVLYDVQGRAVRTLVDGERSAGAHSILWDGRDGRGGRVSSGIYFTRLEANGKTEVRKLIRLD
ncbi:MAG: T9SS type A sorting domain-containing protein, partial [Candidatus Eisenbacteria bacterium]|nr:T9SS type A sorting domain-containing protein [Candidatus Latescibacterota bacterium]MBD3302928.1 T9SS type A sorting domain-containing protein [Candidatus Eisenbacteria bacterium]